MAKQLRFFKITITQKIFLIYLLLLISTGIITSISSYIFFQKLIDKQMSVLDIDTERIKIKLKKMYENKINLFELPDLSENTEKELKSGNSRIFLDPIKEYYPDYNFKVETIEGVLEFKEEPRLIYDKREDKYFFEITRHIKFEENLPFKSLKLSIKLHFYKILLKSLLFGTLFTIIILIPIIIFFSRTIINPIVNISKGARRIASGNLGVQVKFYSNDELGELANSFNFMSKELSKMKRIRDDLLAVISHELRSPLGRIKGYTESLNDLRLTEKEQEVYYKSIFNEIDFLNYMVGEIIEISRLELKKERLFIEKINLSILINSIKKELELTKTIKKEVKYIFNYDLELFCDIDVEKIRRVFFNIIENSVKAEANKISFITTKDNKKIYIKIIDNGHGIPDDQLEIVFEKFYRVDKSRDRKTGGFGLGLAICKGIINEHNGDIFFVKKDKGTELHIELPLKI